jgi:hypothetical protein
MGICNNEWQDDLVIWGTTFGSRELPLISGISPPASWKGILWSPVQHRIAWMGRQTTLLRGT